MKENSYVKWKLLTSTYNLLSNFVILYVIFTRVNRTFYFDEIEILSWGYLL